jgi:uncharacterized membrane protein
MILKTTISILVGAAIGLSPLRNSKFVKILITIAGG